MREHTQDRANVETQAQTQDSGGFQETFLWIVMLVFGGLGCVPGWQPAWLVTLLAFLGLRVIADNKRIKAQAEAAKQAKASIPERATGCAMGWVAVFLLGAGFFVALLGMVR